MKIYKANLNDIEKFFSFFEKSIFNEFPEYNDKIKKYFIETDYSKESISNLLEKGSYDLFLAEENEEIVGYLLVSKIYGGIAWGNWIAVDKNHQGKGIATSLLKMWEENSINEGAHKLELWSDERNVEFYTNRGFSLLGKIPSNYFGLDDYFFYKSIGEPNESSFLKS